MNVSQGLSTPKPPELNMVSERNFVPLPLPLPLPLQPPLEPLPPLESLHCSDETSIDESKLEESPEFPSEKFRFSELHTVNRSLLPLPQPLNDFIRCVMPQLLLESSSVNKDPHQQLRTLIGGMKLIKRLISETNQTYPEFHTSTPPVDPAPPPEVPESRESISLRISDHMDNLFPTQDTNLPVEPKVGLTRWPILRVNINRLTAEDVAFTALVCELIPQIVLIHDSDIAKRVSVEHIRFPGDDDEKARCDFWLRRLINQKACAQGSQIPCAANAQMPHPTVRRSDRPQSGHVPQAKSSNLAGTLIQYHPTFILLKRISN